jgi:hypothetical protein
MQSLIYSRCAPAPSATSSPPPLPSPAESDDDDVFVDIDGNDSDCDAVISSSTRLCWDAVDGVDEKRFGASSDYFGSISGRHRLIDNEVGYGDRPTGNSAIFSLALFASSVLQPSTVPTVSQSSASSGCSSTSSTGTSSARQLHHPAASGQSHRMRRQRRSPSFSPHSPSSSSSSSVSSSGSAPSIVHGEILSEYSSLKPLHTSQSTSDNKLVPGGGELRLGAGQRAPEWQRYKGKQNQHLQLDCAPLPGCGAGARQPTKSNRPGFLIEEILRPDFGVRRRFDCDDGDSTAADSRRMAPDTTAADSKSAQRLQQIGRPSATCPRATPSPLGQTTLNVAERKSSQDNKRTTPVHERLGPKFAVSYDGDVTGKRKLSLDRQSLADDARGRNGAMMASPSSRDSDTSPSQPKRTCSRSSETSRIGVGLTSTICSNGDVIPTFAKSTSSTQSSMSSSSSSSSSSTSSSSTSSTSTVGSVTSTVPLTVGKLPLPAWVYCTRYSDRPSSGNFQHRCH